MRRFSYLLITLLCAIAVSSVFGQTSGGQSAGPETGEEPIRNAKTLASVCLTQSRPSTATTSVGQAPSAPLQVPHELKEALKQTAGGDRSSGLLRSGLAAYGKLPLSFEPNVGQTDEAVRFLSRGLGYALFLTENEAFLSLPLTAPEFHKIPHEAGKFAVLQAPHGGAESVMLRTSLIGANARANVRGVNELAGKTNYFIGHDSKNWHTEVRTFAKVQYEGVYPGVDLVYYGNRAGRLEYDFLVAPGADPSKIRFAVVQSTSLTRPTAKLDGVGSLRIDANGDLVVATAGGEVKYQRPAVYQTIKRTGSTSVDDEHKTFIDAHYVLKSENEVGFEIAPYDAAKPLVIDPAVVYSTFLTGNFWDEALAVAVDSSGSAYATGFTFSSVPSFPVTAGAYQTICGTDGTCNYRNAITGTNNTDAFVTKFTADGSALVYSTYLGGSYDEQGQAIAVDATGNAYLTGYTRSYDFPVTAGGFQTTCAPYVVVSGTTCMVIPGSACAGAPNAGRFAPLNVINAFVTKLNPTGSALVYSTFLGGFGNSNATGIALNAAGEVYVAGSTDAQQQQGFTDSGSCPAGYQTAHPTTASGFFHAPPLASTPNGMAWPSRQTVNGFFSKLSADGTTLKYSTYLGSPCTLSGTTTACIEPFVVNAANNVAVDSAGNAYVTGGTSSPTFSTTSGAFQTVLNQGGGTPGGACGGANCNDAFVARFDPTQSGAASLVYSTFLGGSGEDTGLAVAVDSGNNAYVTGLAGYSAVPSNDFPTTPGAFQTTCPGRTTCSGFDKIFVTKLNPSGNGLVYSSYLGGSSTDDTNTNSIALDSTGRAYITGTTNSTDFPTINATQAAPGASGASNAFLSIFKPDGSGLDFSTYLGDSANTFGTGLALDSSANIYVTGYTLDQNFPTTANAFQSTCAHCGVNGSNRAGFLTKFSALQTNTTSPLTITADNESRAYGGSNPTLTFVATGLLNGDTLASIGVTVTCNTTATASSAVGNYPIACSGPASASNYAITYVAGSLSITPAPLGVAANNVTRVYGMANPGFAFTPGGLRNGDTLASIGVSVTCGTTATASSPVGGYPITCSGPSSSTNYTITYQAGSLSVAPAALTITANNTTKVLDAVNPAFTAKYSGLVNGDMPASLTGALSCTSTANTTSPIGSYTITCSGQSSPNYRISYVSGTLKIVYASSGMVDAAPGHQILPPINVDGSSVYNQGKTIPAQFRVADANGVSIGTMGVVSSFYLTAIIKGTVTTQVENVVDTNTPDSSFRWDATNQQWIFNITTKNLSAGSTYVYAITLNDGSAIGFQFGLR